jgi:hypothetical protein
MFFLVFDVLIFVVVTFSRHRSLKALETPMLQNFKMFLILSQGLGLLRHLHVEGHLGRLELRRRHERAGSRGRPVPRHHRPRGHEIFQVRF